MIFLEIIGGGNIVNQIITVCKPEKKRFILGAFLITVHGTLTLRFLIKFLKMTAKNTTKIPVNLTIFSRD